MKVKPYVKHKQLAPNEIRVINIDECAIEELLFEHLMEHKSDYFDIADISDNRICIMNWDKENNNLTYAIAPSKYYVNCGELDFNVIRKTIGTTVDSLFAPNRYKTIILTEAMIKKRETGDGSPA